MKSALGCNEEIFKKYHKVYVKISNKNADFLSHITSIMNSNKSADEKWNEYKTYIDKAIKDWNNEHSSQPGKIIEAIK